jgi:hypothetical protein
MRIASLLALVVLSAAAHAQLYTCIEDGKKVIRQQPCSTTELRRSEAPPPTQSTPPDTDPATISTPIFSQIVLFQLPAGWKPVHRDATATQYVMEFLPKEQTLQAWREMISVQGFRDLAKNPNATPTNVLARVSSSMEQACGAHTVVQSLGVTKIDSFDAHTAIMGCANLGRDSEIGAYVAIRGSSDVYVIQHAFRAEPFDKSRSPISPAKAQELIGSLQPIKICELSEPPGQCLSRKPR